VTVDGLQLDARYPAQPPALALIRRDVVDAARGCGAGADTLWQIKLAVSEAATNAVLHAYRDGLAGDVHVLLERIDDHLDISIRDSGVGISPRSDSPGAGLGLVLMARVSDRCVISGAAGRGTDVLLCFDLAARPIDAAEKRPYRAAGADLRPQRVRELEDLQAFAGA